MKLLRLVRIARCFIPVDREEEEEEKIQRKQKRENESRRDEDRKGGRKCFI